MKKTIFTLILVSVFSVLLAQQTLTPELRSKYHMISSDEFKSSDMQTKSFVATAPPEGPVRNIAEFERNQGVIISYPNGFEIPYILISELSEDVMVYIMCPSGYQSSVTTSLTSQGVNMSNVEFVDAQVDSEWARDYSPWFIEYGADRQVGIVDFPYNRPMRVNDDEIPIELGQYFNMSVFGMDIEHTGGNYMTDGMGISASCDLVNTENPGLSQTEIDDLVESFLGITNYRLVQDPLDDYIEHIDCWGKFLDVDKMLVARVPASDYRYADFEAMADYWANQTSSYGNKYQVYRVNWMVDKNAYTNSLIMNNKVFVPFNTGTPGNYNADAAAVYEEAMPGYEIIGVSYTNWYSTDALHCRTHEVPDFETLRILHYPYFDTIPYQSEITFSAGVYSFNNSNNIDGVTLFYKVNDGEYSNTAMQNAGGDTYSVTVNGFVPGDKISYYIQASDLRPATETHPFIGAADPHVFCLENTSGICNAAKTEYIKAYPNPATNVLYLITNNLPEDDYRIELYDQQGKLAKSVSVNTSVSDWELHGIDISDLQSGLYFAKAVSARNIYTVRFIKL